MKPRDVWIIENIVYPLMLVLGCLINVSIWAFDCVVEACLWIKERFK